MANVVYGDISPRTAAYVVRDLLERGFPFLTLEKFGQAHPLPKNSTKTMKFRRYFLKHSSLTTFTPKDYFATANFDPTTKQISEGVTPEATAIDKMDIEATLVQYGDRTVISDVVLDTHEDPILQESIAILGEEAPILIEKSRFNVLKAGTNVVYSGTVSTRATVLAVMTAAVQKRAVRTLKRQLAKPITSIVKSTVNYGTEAIAASFVGLCHPDLQYDLEALVGWVSVADYGAVVPFEGEIGKFGEVRYILSTIFEPWTGTGACGIAGGTTQIKNGAGENHVYPILYLGQNAYGIIPLKGAASLVPMVVNPKPSDSDPMAQRGHVAWKTMTTTIILNDFFMVRAEVACTQDSSMA
jgi:N4-gp56 family major capsid protein